MSLLQKKLNFVNLFFSTSTCNKGIHTLIISADDFLTGCFLADFIVYDAISGHIYTHVSRGFVWAFSHNLLKHGLYNRENLNITVIVDCSNAISIQMKWIDHIYIIQISCSSLISKVHRMLQRNIPDRESLKLSVSCADSSFILVVKLGKAGCHFSASRSGCSNNNERAGGFNIVILSVSFITYDQRGVAWISWNIVKNINSDSKLLQTLFKCICSFLSGIACDANTSYIETSAGKLMHETQYIFVIGNAKITAYLILLNIRCTDNNYDFSLVGKLHKHAQLAVRFKTWENAGCVIIIK